jgi:hypothetical protein
MDDDKIKMENIQQCEDEDENIITTENNACAKKWSDGCTLNNVIDQ